MNDTTISLAVGTILIIGVASIVFSQTRPAPSAPASGTDGSYTMEDVAAHASADDCWTVIDGRVYELTAWVTQHPGGAQAIAQLCGIDGSVIFHGQHGTNEPQASILASFEIGTLQ